MKLKNELIVICLILFILISISAVSAQDNNTEIITINSDDNNDVISIDNSSKILTGANDGSFADLNNKINGGSSANIVLDKDYSYSTKDTIKEGIVINKDNIVIDGKGHTIDAKGKSRVFNITGTTVTLKNIVFTHGMASSGGAIRGYGDNLRIFNCTFIDNTAQSCGGAIYSYPYSYSVFVNSTFINNKAQWGGAIFTRGYVYNHTVIETYYGDRHDIINCTFDGNTATDDGGALAAYGQLETTERPKNDYVNIRGCLFTNNNAPKGEAISNIMTTYINMTDSVILGNPENVIYSFGRMFFADNNWWGNTVNNKAVRPNITTQVDFNKWLYFDFDPHLETSSATVSINNLYDSKTKETSTYSTNRLSKVNVKFTGVNATFDKTNAYLDHTGKYEANFVLLGDATLTANCEGIKISKKLKIGGLSELAALIRNTDDDSVIKLQKDYVYIPGIDSPNSYIQISDKHNLVIDGNGYTINGMGKTRLFAVDKDSLDITFKNMKIVNGFSSSDDGADGPAGVIAAMNTKFINCTFINNTATGYGSGGALHINAMNVEIDDCKFINNTHTTSAGGAIYARGDNLNIANTLFENNAANSSKGGALYLVDGGNIEDCTFIHNSANVAGASYSYDLLTIDNSTFMSNRALAANIQSEDSDYGGAGAVYAVNAKITDSRFINNTAVSGAAITFAGSSTTIDRSVFINNTVTKYNGIIYGMVEGGEVINSIFLNNDYHHGYVISSLWGKLKADYNWFGNTAKDYATTPDVTNLAIMSKWIFLNATDIIYDFDTNKLQTQFDFFVYDSKTKNVVKFDEDELPEVNFAISTQNLTIDKKVIAPGETLKGNVTSYITIGEKGPEIHYDYKGTITAAYENVKYTIPFTFQQKTWFEADSPFELMKDESKYLDFTLHPFEYDSIPFLFDKGRITYTINDTKVISFNKQTGKVKGLKVGLATITFNYNGIDVIGRDKYTASNITILVNVTRAETHIVNPFDVPSQINVGQSDNIIIGLEDYRNKSVYGYGIEFEVKNDNPDILRVDAAGSQILLKGLSEGTAHFTVKFNGNKDYLPSSRDFTIIVGRKDPNLNVSPKNIEMKVSERYYVAIFSDSPEIFTYESNDTGVAFMDDECVHAIGDGVAKITIKFAGNEKYRPASDYIIVKVSSLKSYIDVNKTFNLMPTDSYYMGASLKDMDGNLITYLLNYTSSNPKVVTVSENGELRAVGEGTAKITISSNGFGQYKPAKAEVSVKVAIGTSEIAVDSDVEINYNQIVRLNATLNHDGVLNYTSSNSDIVSVDKNGYIEAKKIGQATITITYNGSQKYKPCTAKVNVKVLKAPTKIVVGKTFAWIIDDKDSINAYLNPYVGYLTFKSNNESVVKVDDWGNVQAISVGKTTVVITYPGNENYLPSSETVEVAVYADHIPTSIEVNKTFDLLVNDKVDMNAVINPSNAGKLTYESSNPDVVSVENGKLIAKKVGKATVNVIFIGDTRFLSSSATVDVTVSRIPTSISADDSITVNLTETAYLKYVFSHPKAGPLKFIFSDIDVASIENNRIKGEEVGNATLTIKFEGNENYAPSTATVKINVVDVETAIIAPDSIEVNVTDSKKIDARLDPKLNAKFRYVSNNNNVISVDGNGELYAIKLGNATVTVIFDGEGKYRSSSKTVNVVVTDVQPIIDVVDSIDVNVTESASIIASVTPREAGNLKFTNLNPDIISIDQKGNIKALKVGSAEVKISLDANGKYRSASKTVTVNVCDVESRIIVENDDIDLVYGEQTTINAILKPYDSGKLEFSSSDENVVTVDENGNIKSVKPGLATITVSYAGEGKYRSAQRNISVNVVRAPSSIDINDTLKLEIGAGYMLHPDTTPLNLKLTYESSDENVIEVDNNGYVFTVSYGSAILNINFAGNEYYMPSNASVSVTVNPRVTEIRVKNNITIGFGESMDLGAKAYATIADIPIDGELKYISTNPEIVSVDEKTGLISANDIGKSSILISYGGDHVYEPSQAIVDVEVTTRTTSIKVNETSISLYVDDTQTISAELINGPMDAKLNYISANANVVRVNPSTGEITAVGEGTTTVTVRYPGNEDYHSSYAEVLVSVSKYKTHIKSKNSFEMQVYDEMDLNAEVTPNGGTLIYTSSNEDVVSVDSKGKLTAKKSGDAIVTIKFAGDRKYLPSQKDIIVDVSKIPTSINLTNLKLGTGVEFDLGKIVLPEGVPTKAKYYEYISWDSEVFDVDNGVITTYHKGNAELYVGFLGDDVYLPSNATVMVSVVKNVLSPGEYNITVEVDDDAGEATFTIVLPDDAQGNFIANLNGGIYGEVVVDGRAVVSIDELGPGDYTATLRYAGDDKYEAVTQSVKFRVGKFKIDKNKDVDVVLGSTAIYKVHLTKDTQAMENKTITFKVNGKKYTAVTDKYGYAFIKVKLPAMKKYKITAKYGSIKVSNKIKVHVIVAKDLKTLKSKNLKVKISLKKVNKKYPAKKKVTLKFNGKTYTGKTNKKGVVTFTLKKSAFAKLKVGKKYKYTVKYSTDSVTKTIKLF